MRLQYFNTATVSYGYYNMYSRLTRFFFKLQRAHDAQQ